MVYNLKEMSNKDIVEELKACGLKKSDFCGDDGRWIPRQGLIAILLKPLHEARDMAKETLGKDFAKAVSFWKQLRNIQAMDEHDYPEMTESWEVLKTLVNISHENGAFDLRETANALKEIFCPTADFSAYSDEELASFVQASIEQFQLSAFTERLVKESTDIIKMSMDNVEFTPDGAVFDSSEAASFTGKKIEYSKKNSIMRRVESSEDGISRMLQEKGKTSITVFMGQQGRTPEEQQFLDNRKREVFTHGITDVATGKHYLFAFQNPSSARKANFMFVEADDWDEIKALWCEVTGTGSLEELVELL